MWRYLINPSGVLVEVAQDRYDELLKQGFKEAPNKTVQSFKFRRQVQTEIQSAPSVYLKTTKDKKDGYGESQEWLIDALALEGINLTPEYMGQRIGMVYGYPHHLQNLKTPVKILYSMFESTKIPEEWTQYLKLADKIFVPSKFCQEAFKARGFESTVIPLGYEHYEYIDRDYSQPFTFLHYDAFNTRKGWDILFQAFTEEFTTDEAQLVLKTIRKPLPITKKDYPNVRVVAEVMEVSDMKELLADAHCFVFPSRGEGFGIPPLEALATGIPGIIPNRTGMSEYFTDKYFLGLKTKEIPPIYQFHKKDVGVMYEVQKDDLRKQLRWAYENKDKIEQMGLKGSEWVKKYHIRNTAKRFKEEFSKLKAVPTKRQKLAFIMDNIPYYSGGRYCNYMQAIALNQKYDVTVYTNQPPIFVRDFKQYPLPTMEICDIGNLDVKADVYVGSPEPGAIKAMELGKKYNKPIYLIVFDSPEWIENSDHANRSETKRDSDMKTYMNQHDIKPTFITLTENAIPSFKKWYEYDNFTYCPPPVNSRTIDLFNAPKQNWIWASSRVSMRKAWEETLLAFKPYSQDYQLHIVTHMDGKLIQIARQMGIDANSIVIHTQISDLEKFAILSQCKATISSSHFEGFGMWATESRAMGVPVACYDLPSLAHIEGLHRAEMGNVKELSEKLGEALKSKPKRYTDHDFDVIGDRLLSIVSEDKTEELGISVMMIVLNEEKYISEAIESVVSREEVKEVIIVEGADKKYPRANKNGLSVDKTATKIKYLAKKYKKIKYIRYGWAESKEELRQKCIDESSQKGWGLFVDGDEVWEEWDNLIKGIKENKDKGIIYFRHRHFWKDENHVAVGGQWDSYLFRLFRFTGDNKITFHGGPPTNTKEYGTVKLDVWVNHYGYCKDEQDVQDKIEYYKRRDKDLDVKDTFTNWKEGQPSSPTHPKGTSVVEYKV